jgi:glycosyl transferase, family 25
MDVYVINLDRQIERLRWMERNLGEARIAFRRVRAIDATRLKPDFITRRTKHNSHKLTRFDVAAIMSHRKAWRALLRSSAPHCVVFEDDIHVGHGFAALAAALDAGGVEFDIVKLESVGERVLIDKGNGHDIAGRQLCPLRSAYMGAAGYVVNRAAAAALLQSTRNLAVPIDWFMFANDYLTRNGLRVLQTVPGIVAQEEHLRRLGGGGELRSCRPPRLAGADRKVRRAPMEKAAREALRPLRQLVAALARYRRMRAEPGLSWGRIGFE